VRGSYPARVVTRPDGPSAPFEMRDVSTTIHAFRKRFARRRSKGLMANTERALFKRGTPQDVSSPRAKAQRHGKVTADRWNQ
jgi:hypothetical protein